MERVLQYNNVIEKETWNYFNEGSHFLEFDGTVD